MPARRALATQNRQSIQRVSTLLKVEARKVLAQGSGLGQQDFGGFLRTTVPGLISRYGNVNAVMAANYYDEVRKIGAKGAKSYKAALPIFDATERADTIVNYGMATFMAQGFDPVPELIAQALTYPVAQYNRETIDYNAGLDTSAKTVQRIAEPNACAFCATLAFATTTTAQGKTVGTRTFSYDPNFHDNCHCTVEVIFEGEEPIVPDYYKDFAMEYADAKSASSSGSLSDVLSTMRQQTGRS